MIIVRVIVKNREYRVGKIMQTSLRIMTAYSGVISIIYLFKAVPTSRKTLAEYKVL